MKINKVDLFRKYLDLLMVEYVDPCTGEHVCHSMSPTTTLVPINGIPCPVVYPVIYNATSYSTEALLLGAVQTTYPGFTITYNNTTCEFSFTGTSTPPTTIELSTVVPPSTIVPISGVSCPVTYPVNYNGNSYTSESALLSAVQGVYPTFTITYNNVSCEFTFVGNGTTPTNIVLSAPVASCNPVTNLQLVNVGTTTIDLMWDIPTPTPNDYKVEVYDGATLIQTNYTSTNSISITGLSSVTTYDIKVISRCSTGDTNNSTSVDTQVTTTAFPLPLTNGYRVRQLYVPSFGPEENFLELGYTNPLDRSQPSAIEFDYSACGYPEVATNMTTMVDITSTVALYPFATCWGGYGYKTEAYLKFDHYFSGSPSTYYVYNVPLISATDYSGLISACGTTMTGNQIDFVTYNYNYLLGAQPSDNTCTLFIGNFVGDITGTHVLEILDSTNTAVTTLTSVLELSGNTSFTGYQNPAIFDAVYLEPGGKYQLLNCRLRKLDNSCTYNFKLQIIKSKVVV